MGAKAITVRTKTSNISSLFIISFNFLLYYYRLSITPNELFTLNILNIVSAIIISIADISLLRCPQSRLFLHCQPSNYRETINRKQPLGLYLLSHNRLQSHCPPAMPSRSRSAASLLLSRSTRNSLQKSKFLNKNKNTSAIVGWIPTV